MRRRELLTAGVATLLVRGVARAAPFSRDAELRQLLDRIAQGTDLPDARHALAAFGDVGLSPSARADRITVTWGLATDETLVARHPPGATTSGEASFVSGFERSFGAAIRPVDLHDRFTAELSRVAVRADRLLRGEGLRSGTLGARFRAFARQPRWLYSDDAAGRADAVADMNRTLARVQPHLARLIANLPASVRTASVRWLTDAEIAAGRGGFRDMGDGQPPAYAVDLRQVRARPRWSLPSVVHHELLPGHLAQAAFQAIATPHPLRVKYAPTFGEGWAIYAETMAADAGLFCDDAPATLGYLQWLLFRLGRACVDTGVHTRLWDEGRARRFLEDHQGDPAVFAPFDSDIVRIVRSPGERAAEAMTWLAFADLRDALAPHAGARRADLHHRMLRDGPMPLPLLRAWLTDTRQQRLPGGSE